MSLPGAVLVQCFSSDVLAVRVWWLYKGGRFHRLRLCSWRRGLTFYQVSHHGRVESAWVEGVGCREQLTWSKRAMER